MSDTEILQQRNRELTILNAIAAALGREINLRAALHTALAQVADLLALRTGWVWLLHEETGDPYLAASLNLPPVLLQNPGRMAGGCHCLTTYQNGDFDGAANVNVIECSRLWGLVDGTDGLRYHASIPLYGTQARRLGVFNVADTEWRELAPEDLRLLYTIGDLVGIAIERARLFERSTRLAAAEERNRLAREIHDTLAQSVAAIALQLETAEALLDSVADVSATQPRVREILGRALGLSRATLEEARRSVMDLRAAPLEAASLPEAVQRLIDEMSSGVGVKGKLLVEGERPLPARLEMGIFRVTQEALTNVARHAAASRVIVKLAYSEESVCLTVADDGQGFDINAIPPGHYGLIGMNERAHLLGGTLILESCPGEGTRVALTVPHGATG